MKQTAVQWLFLMLNNPNRDQEFANKLFQKALEMEKEQMIDAYQANSWGEPDGAEQYYNETFKSE